MRLAIAARPQAGSDDRPPPARAVRRSVEGRSHEAGPVPPGTAGAGSLAYRLALAPAARIGAAPEVGRPEAPEEREAEAAAERAVPGVPGVMPSPETGDDPGRDGGAAVQGFLASSGGTPLPDSMRRDMGRRLGRDFGEVRVHTGPAAAASARAIGAAAYTFGRDVVFGEGRWRPDTRAGRRLLAHELAHVAQEGGRAARRVRRTVLMDYVDNDPKHDPSRLTDAEIQATDEYKVASTLTIPPATTPLATKDEALLATRLWLRDYRAGEMHIPRTDEGIAEIMIERAKRQLGVLTSAKGQVGELEWAPFNTTLAVSDPGKLRTEFGKWILAGGPEPDRVKGVINCWEMILFGAYKGGYITKARIKAIYDLAVDNVKKGNARFVGDTVESELRGGAKENVFDAADPDTPEPLPGDLVIFKEAANHAAISLGTRNAAGEHEVLSLWNRPSGISKVQKTTIEALTAAGAATPVKFWNAKW